MTWSAAVGYCQSRTYEDKSTGVSIAIPGRLAAPTSADEYDTLVEMLVATGTLRTWVGVAASGSTDGLFRWHFGPIWQPAAALDTIADPGVNASRFGAHPCVAADDPLGMICAARLASATPSGAATQLQIDTRSETFVATTATALTQQVLCEYPLLTMRRFSRTFTIMSDEVAAEDAEQLCTDRPPPPEEAAQAVTFSWQMPVLETDEDHRAFVKFAMLTGPIRASDDKWPRVLIGLSDEAAPGSSFRWQARSTAVFNAVTSTCLVDSCRWGASQPLLDTAATSYRHVAVGDRGQWFSIDAKETLAAVACAYPHPQVDCGAKLYFIPAGSNPPVTYSEAVQTCAKQRPTWPPPRLATVNTYREASLVYDMVSAHNLERVWISDLDPFTHEHGSVGMTRPDPNNPYTVSSSGKVDAAPRASLLSVVCERRVVNAVPLPGGTKLIIKSTQRMALASARQLCAASGGRVASPATTLSMELLGTLVRAALPRRATVWLSGKCSAGTCEWDAADWNGGVPSIFYTGAACNQATCKFFVPGPVPDDSGGMSLDADGRAQFLTTTQLVLESHFAVCEVPSSVPDPPVSYRFTKSVSLTRTRTKSLVVARVKHTPTLTKAWRAHDMTQTMVMTATKPLDHPPQQRTSTKIQTLGSLTRTLRWRTPTRQLPQRTPAPTQPTQPPTPSPPPPPRLRTHTKAPVDSLTRTPPAARPGSATATRQLAVSVSNSTSITGSATRSIQQEARTIALPAPPPVKGNMVASEATLGTIMSSGAAQAVTTTSQSAVLAAGAVSPTAATKGANLAAIASIVECVYTPDSNDPSEMEVVLLWDFGASDLAGAIGPSISVTAALWVLHATLAVVAVYAPRWRKRFGVLASLLLAYFVPTVIGLTTTITFHGETAADRALGAALFLAALGTVAAPLVLIARTPADRLRRVMELSTAEALAIRRDGGESSSDAYLICFVALYSPSRDLGARRVRLHFFEDICAAVAMATVAGVHPAEASACYVVGGMIATIAGLHAAYCIAVWPFDRMLDTVFAIVISLGQLALAVVALIVLSNDEWAPVLGGLALAQTAIFMLQTVASIADSAIHRWRKHRAAATQASKESRISPHRCHRCAGMVHCRPASETALCSYTGSLHQPARFASPIRVADRTASPDLPVPSAQRPLTAKELLERYNEMFLADQATSYHAEVVRLAVPRAEAAGNTLAALPFRLSAPELQRFPPPRVIRTAEDRREELRRLAALL
jgi:hypothetical protein